MADTFNIIDGPSRQGVEESFSEGKQVIFKLQESHGTREKYEIGLYIAAMANDFAANWHMFEICCQVGRHNGVAIHMNESLLLEGVNMNVRSRTLELAARPGSSINKYYMAYSPRVREGVLRVIEVPHDSRDRGADLLRLSWGGLTFGNLDWFSEEA